ncbi:LysR substrate-binding domain-containing protein [Gluconacetobacter tumulicola]
MALLRAFVVIGREEGIRRAAKTLMVDHAVMSRHLRDLERFLGRELVDRASGRLTPAGRAYHDRVALALDQIEGATLDTRAHVAERSLTIWCVPGFAFHWLAGRCQHFRASHPDIDLVIRPSETPAMFRDDGADADIRFVRDGCTGTMRQMEITRPSVFPVASPDCVRALPFQPVCAADLAMLPLLEEGSDQSWNRWFATQCPSLHLSYKPVAKLWQAHMVLAAARESAGIALANRFLVETDLARGTLTKIRPLSEDFVDVSFGAYVLRAPDKNWGHPPIASFASWLVEEVRKS